MSGTIRKWGIVFALLSFFVLAFCSSLTPRYEQSYQVCYYGSVVGGLPEMTNGSELSQVITLSKSTAYISVTLTKQDTVISNGTIRAAVYDAQGELLCEKTEAVVSGNADQDVTFWQTLSPGTYRITLSFADFTDGEYMNAYLSSENDALGELTINGEVVDGQLYLTSASEKEIYAIPWLAAALVLVLLAYLAWRREKQLLRACVSGAAVCTALGGLSVLLHLRGQSWHTIMLLLELAALALCALLFTTKQQRSDARQALKAWGQSHRKAILYIAALLAVSAAAGAAAEALTDESFLWPKALFWAGAVFVIGYHILFWKQLRRQLHRSFFVTALVLGLLIGLAAPAIHSCWDEETHYERVMRLSGGPITYLSVADTTMIHRSLPATFSLAQRVADEATLESKIAVFSREVSRSAWLPERLAYFPEVCGIWIGQILGLSFQNTTIMGRCAALAIYVWILSEAMKRLRGGKLLVYVFGLLPTMLFLEASYSYDGWVNCLVVFGFCCFVGAMQRPEKYTVTWETLLMLAALVFGCMPKAVYTPIILLLLLVPKSKFADARQRKRYNWLVVGATAAGVALYLVLFVLQGALSYTTDVRGGTDVSAAGQLKYILSDPLQYAAVLLKFLGSYLSIENTYGYTTFFAYLGGTDLSIPAVALLAAAALTDRSEEDRTLRRPASMALSLAWLFALACLVATSMYLAFTAVGLNTISGCQPRYLLPLLFPAWLLVGNWFTLPQKVREPFRCGIAAAMTVLTFVCVWTGIVGKITA